MSINGTKLPPEFYSAGKTYWSAVEPTVDGMLGGYTQVIPVDIRASSKLLEQYFGSDAAASVADGCDGRQQTRVLDCGAGIGRVTKHLLLKYFDVVDLLEQDEKFLNEAKNYLGADNWKRIGKRICHGLQEFEPDPNLKYDCIWIQWVTGHLTDDDFCVFLKKCKRILKPNGVIVVKDNTTSSDEIDNDTNDSSVTRPHWLFKDIFARANLTLLTDRRQYKMPKGLYPVRMFVLR